MNSIKWILSFSVAMLFTLAVHAQSVSGVMMVVKGDIKVTSKDGKTEAGKVGKKVSAGDTIIAGPDSRAKIVMSDKNVINVSPDSKIVIEKYENDGKDKKNVELNVVYGKVRASVEQKYDGEKSKFNVKTPSAVAGVRGTDFLAGYSPTTKTASVTTFSGTVAVGTPGPGGSIQNPVFVQPGQMTSVGAGKPPEPPKAVPKDELNKMNNETKADTAGSGKSDTQQSSADAKGDEKKDEQKDEKKDDKKDSKDEKKDAQADKKDEKKDEKKDKKDAQADKKEERKDKKDAQNDKKDSRQPASAGSDSGSGGGTTGDASSGTTSGSTGGTSSGTTTSSGPVASEMPTAAPPPPPPPPPPPAMFIPPPPITTLLPPPPPIDPALVNTKSATTIILAPQ